MIKKIIEILNVGRFSSLRPENGSESDFAKFNVIYAENGAGKSTLCDVLRSMGARDGSYVIGRKRIGSEQPPKIRFLLSENGKVGNALADFRNGEWRSQGDLPTVHVYDERFVRENVYVGGQISIEQRRNVYELALGSQNVQLNKAVEQAATQYERAKAAFDASERMLKQLLPSGYDIKTFRSLPRLEDPSLVEQLTRRLQSATVRRQQEEKIRRKPLLSPLPLPTLPAGIDDVLAETIDSAVASAEKAIKEHLQACTTGTLPVGWLRQGTAAVKDDHCPFCGHPMDGTSLLALYRAYFSGAVEKAEERRAAIRQGVEQEFGEGRAQSVVSLHRENAAAVEWWRDVCGVAVDIPMLEVQAIVGQMLDVRQAILAALVRKEGSLSEKVELTAAETRAAASWDDARRRIEVYNQAVGSANEVIARYREDAADADLAGIQLELQVARCREKRHSPEVEQAFSDYDAKKQAKRTAENAKAKANESLKRQSAQLFAQYGDRINGYLRDFGVSFRVENRGIDLHGGASGRLVVTINGVAIDSTRNASGDPSCASLANTLSGGERSALALAYFLTSIEASPNLADAVVVFDDPYDSQDRSRYTITISKIASVAAKCAQCFVFSHDIDFANEVSRIKDVGDKRTFKIGSLGESVNFRKQDLPSILTKSYEMDYKTVDGFIKAPSDDPERLRSVVRCIRQILEAHLRSKFVGVFPTKCWIGDMIGMIRTATDDSVLKGCRENRLLEDLTLVNEYTSHFHHGGNDGVAGNPNARELLTYAERALSIIRR